MTEVCSHVKLTVLMAKTLGKRVKELRDNLDLSLRELAGRIDNQASATHLSDIEQSNRFPSDELLAKLAKALDTTVEDLKQYDLRPPVEEIKKQMQVDPQLGFALRKLVDKKVSSDEILKFVNKQKRKQ